MSGIPALRLARQPLAGSELKQINRSIHTTNIEIMERFREEFKSVRTGNSRHLRFIDTCELLEKYDHKNTGMKKKLIDAGFQNADGMHPGGAGYALQASDILQFMGIPHDRDSLLIQAYSGRCPS